MTRAFFAIPTDLESFYGRIDINGESDVAILPFRLSVRFAAKMTKPTSQLPLIRLSTLGPLIEELLRRGVDPAPMLRSMNLPDTLPISPELFVSPNVMYTAVESISGQPGDPFFGYEAGRRMPLQRWVAVAEAAQKAHTIGGLLSRFIIDVENHSSATTFFLRTEQRRATFGVKRIVEPKVVPAHNDGFYVGFLSRLLEKAMGDGWEPSSVLFEVSDPDAVPGSAAGIRVSAGDRLGPKVKFPTVWLFQRFEPLNDTRTDLSAIAAPRSLIEAVHIALRPHIHDRNLTVDKAAEICGYGKRRLARELKKDGTTIAREVAALRSRQAEKELIESDLRVSDIAEHVGFTDPTVFSRAFKNWTGMSPLEYRRTHNHTKDRE